MNFKGSSLKLSLTPLCVIIICARTDGRRRESIYKKLEVEDRRRSYVSYDGSETNRVKEKVLFKSKHMADFR